MDETEALMKSLWQSYKDTKDIGQKLNTWVRRRSELPDPLSRGFLDISLEPEVSRMCPALVLMSL